MVTVETATAFSNNFKEFNTSISLALNAVENNYDVLRNSVLNLLMN